MAERKKPYIGAVLVAYQAAGTLETFWNEFPKDLVDEVILVDDCSSDGTFELAQKLGIRSYRNPENLGFGGNMKRAFSLAEELGFDVIIDIHPDGEYDPAAIGPALSAIRSGAEIVLGNRFYKFSAIVRSGIYPWKLMGLIGMNALARSVLNLEITDLHQGFRVYDRTLLARIDYHRFSNDYLFSFELIRQAVLLRARFAEVPVKARYRGRKRGATLYHTFHYSVGVLGMLADHSLKRIRNGEGASP